MDMMPTVSAQFNRRTQEFVLQRLGDQIWEQVCDTVPLDTPFQARDLVGRIDALARYSSRTQSQYIRAVLLNVLEQWNYLPEEEGAPPIQRIKRGWYTLPSVPSI